MDDLVGGLILGVIAIVAIVWVAAMVLYMALLVLIIAGPTVGCVYWLRSLNRRYEFSPRKKWQCAGVTLCAFALPFVILLADPTSGRLAFWLAVPLSLGCLALFLTIESYRQTIWPVRRELFAAARTALWTRVKRYRQQQSFDKTARIVIQKEREFSELLDDSAKLRSSIERLTRDCDPALYSGAVLRWKRDCQSVDYPGLLARIRQIRDEVDQTERSHPRHVTLALQAAVVRMEAQDRLIAGQDQSSYSVVVGERDALKRELDKLDRELLRLDTIRNRSLEHIARIKNQVLVVN